MEYRFEVEYHGQRMNAEQARERLYVEQMRPFYLLRPRITIDGNQWLALYGENLQEGVAGFGDTPEKAAVAFDLAWLNESLGGE